MDSMPATYTATLVDGGRTFRVMEHGDNNEDESTTAERAVNRVVSQALAARKAGG
jgi:phosphoribosylamine-glycine ligase